MKVLAVLLLCAIVAVQGRSGVIEKSSKSLAAQGDAPWLLHLRVAVSTSGLLNSGAGALIANRWALTSAETVKDARFIWVRYDAVNVINPSLVTETSIVINSADDVLALVDFNRFVVFTDYISAAALSSSSSVPDTAVFYGYGDNDGAPGESLQYFNVTLEEQDDGSIIATSDDGTASEFDVGAPLVSNGTLVAVLVQEGDDDNAGEFVQTTDYLDWIIEETGLELDTRTAQLEDSLRVKVVN